MQISSYKTRFFDHLEDWETSEWTFKIHGITVNPHDEGLHFDPVLLSAARAKVESLLPTMQDTPHHCLGFVILHHGEDANWLLAHWWTDECICRQILTAAPLAGPYVFKPASRDLMACVWELIPIDFERRAWVSTAMAGKGRRDYLNARMKAGFY